MSYPGRDHCGRLAAELERDRREVGARRCHHPAADRGGSGEHQVVEGQGREGGGDLGPAGDHGHLVRAEVVGHQLAEQRGECRRVLGELDHRAVAGDQRACQRADRKPERVVPGNDDADHADRAGHDVSPGRQEPLRDPHAAGTHPAPAVAQRGADLGEAGKDLGDLGLEAGPAAEVGVDRLLDGGLVLHDQAAQPLQPVAPGRPVGEGGRAVRIAHRGEQSVQVERAVVRGHGGSWMGRAGRAGPGSAQSLAARAGGRARIAAARGACGAGIPVVRGRTESRRPPAGSAHEIRPIWSY